MRIKNDHRGRCRSLQRLQQPTQIDRAVLNILRATDEPVAGQLRDDVVRVGDADAVPRKKNRSTVLSSGGCSCGRQRDTDERALPSSAALGAQRFLLAESPRQTADGILDFASSDCAGW